MDSLLFVNPQGLLFIIGIVLVIFAIWLLYSLIMYIYDRYVKRSSPGNINAIQQQQNTTLSTTSTTSTISTSKSGLITSPSSSSTATKPKGRSKTTIYAELAVKELAINRTRKPKT